MSDYERDLILILRQLKADDQDYIVKLAERIAATTAETPSPVVPFVKAPAPARK